MMWRNYWTDLVQEIVVQVQVQEQVQVLASRDSGIHLFFDWCDTRCDPVRRRDRAQRATTAQRRILP